MSKPGFLKEVSMEWMSGDEWFTGWVVFAAIFLVIAVVGLAGRLLGRWIKR
ncbi:hypothetical protein HYV21_00830 [Candidatus Microgenomates bacterium]|nr:hypothetical protein [Candidatus Microgenomates bacterium]